MRKWKRFLILLLLAALLTAGCSAASRNMKEALRTFAATKGNTVLALELQNTLYAYLNGMDTDYVSITKDAAEHVTAIQIHAVALSLLASELTIQLLERIESYRNEEFGIPIGNLTSSAILSGRGPMIPLRTVAAGNVANEIQSTLQSAGINQTLHRVALHFAVTVCYLSPLHGFSDTISFDLVIAETLVVGDVPIYRD